MEETMKYLVEPEPKMQETKMEQEPKTEPKAKSKNAKELSLRDAITEARKHFRPIKKTAINPHMKNRYATLEEIIDAIVEPLAAFGINIMQTPRKIDGEWVMVTVISKGDEVIEEHFPLLIGSSNSNPMQSFGGACSYARRYSLLGLFCLAAEDDDGESVGKVAPAKEPLKPKVIREKYVPTGDEATDIRTMLKLANRKEEDMLKYVRERTGKDFKSIEELAEDPETVNSVKSILSRAIDG